MPSITVEVTTEQWEGNAWARQRANEGKPPTIEVDGEQVPNPDVVISDNAYFTARVGDFLNSYVQQKMEAESDGVPVPPPVPVVDGVPQLVVRKKALRAMNDKGVLDAVKGFIAAIPDVQTRNAYQIEFDESKTFGRHHSMVLAVASALSWTEAFLDELFVYADALPDA